MGAAESSSGRTSERAFGRLAGEVASIARANLFFLVILAVGAVARAFVIVAYQPALLLQRDTYIYLDLTFSSFGANPTGFRPMVYPLLLRPLLFFGDLAVVPAVQHTAGLAMAVIIYVVLRRLGLGSVLATLGVVPLLLDGYQLIIEQYVLTEAAFQLFIVTAFTLLVWWKRPSLVVVVLAGALLALAGLTRFVGISLIVPALIYVALRRLGWLRAGALVVGFAVPLAAYALWFKGSSGTLGVTNRNGFFLYGRVASFADCDEINVPPAQRKLCLEDVPTGRGVTQGVFVLDLPKEFLKSPDANSVLSSFSKRVILAQPFDYAGAVVGDLLRYFDWHPPPAQEPNVKRWRFPRTFSDADPHRVVRRFRGSPAPRYGLEGSFAIRRPIAEKLRSYQDVVYSYGPLLGVFALLGLLGAVVGLPLREGRNLRVEAALFVLSGLGLLLASVMTTVYHYRYVLATAPLLAPAGAIGAAVLLGRLRERRTQ